MQKAEVVLGTLRTNAKREDFMFKRLYRHLYNPQLYGAKPAEAIAGLVKQLRSERYHSSGKPEDAWIEEAVVQLLGAVFPEMTEGREDGDQWQRVRDIAEPRWAVWCRLERGHELWEEILHSLRSRVADGRFLELLRRLHHARGALAVKRTLREVHAGCLQRAMRPLSPTTDRLVLGQEFLFLGREAGAMNRQMAVIQAPLEGQEDDTSLRWVANIHEQAMEFGPYVLRGSHRGCLVLVRAAAARQIRRPFTQHGRPAPRDDRLHLPSSRILSLYQQELMDVAQAFQQAVDVRKKLREFHYYHWNSLLKTLAKKDRLSLKKVSEKYWAGRGQGDEGLGIPGMGATCFYPAGVRHLFSA